MSNAALTTREPETVGELVDNLPAPHAKAPAPVLAVTPMQMLQIAVERGADLDMLERLMTLQERWEAGEARKAYVAALNAFKADPPRIIKDKHVSFPSRNGEKPKTEYDHASLHQVCEVVGAALSKHGLSHRWEVDQADGVISVTCVLMHHLGHSERVTLRAGADQSGGKNNIQAVGSTVTYLERYTLLAITGLSAKDQDDDGRAFDAGDAISTEQKDEIIALMQETGADTRKFLDFLNIDALDDLPASRFAEAKAALLRKQGRAK